MNIKDLNFKKLNKMAACTSPPWAELIPIEIRVDTLRKIREEMLDTVGQTYNECPKRLTCFKKTCLGRPLPWASQTAQPYLEAFKKTHNLKLNKETNELELVIDTDCKACPIVNKCTSLCNQVLDFIERDKNLEIPKAIVSYEDVEEILEYKENAGAGSFFVSKEDIPWEVISDKKAEIIKKYIFEHRDYKSIAEKLDLNNQSRVKYEMYSAINKLSEYAAVRKFLKKHWQELTDRQRQIFSLVYYENKTFVDTANTLKVSKQSIQQTVSRILKKYKVKWPSYVKKKNNRIIYNVPELFK
jgi:predicted DNA-binding protein YlxM (UPF0122 family)